MSEKNIQKEKKAGFTLAEVIITVAIIFVLTTILTIHLINAQNRAKRSEAKTFIGKLEIAISMYRMDTGLFPPDDKSSASLRQALDPDNPDPAVQPEGWRGPYIEFTEDEVNNKGELLDPWGKGKKDDRKHIYTYRANEDNDPFTTPPFHNRASFDIYSKGPDGKTGSDDKEANEFEDGNYTQNGIDDDGDGVTDELSPGQDKNGYLEDDINNW